MIKGWRLFKGSKHHNNDVIYLKKGDDIRIEDNIYTVELKSFLSICRVGIKKIKVDDSLDEFILIH